MRRQLAVLSKSNDWHVNANLFFSILIFALALFFAPSETYDRYRHAERFDAISDGESEFLDYYVFGVQKDFVYYVLMYIGSKLGLSAPVFFGITNGLTVLALFYGLSRSINWRNVSKLNAKIIWAFFALSVSYISLFSGVRFYLALAFFSLFTCFFSRGEILKSAFFLSFASITHFSFSVFFVSFLFLIKPSFLRLILFASLGLGILSVSGLFDIYTFVSEASSLTSYDGFGEASKSYAELKGESHRNFLFYVINFWIVIPSILFALKHCKDSRLGVLLMTSIIVMMPYADNYAVFGRYFLVFNLLSFYNLAEVGVTSETKGFFYALGASGAMRFAMDIHDNFDVYLRSFFDFV